MTHKKLDELIADLGYVLLYLKQAQADGKWNSNLNRARELTHKVGEALIKERGPKPKPNGRSFEDVLRPLVIIVAKRTDLFRDAKLTDEQLSNLYTIVRDENENWDGEPITEHEVVRQMCNRFMSVGLTPSRN